MRQARCELRRSAILGCLLSVEHGLRRALVSILEDGGPGGDASEVRSVALQPNVERRECQSSNGIVDDFFRTARAVYGELSRPFDGRFAGRQQRKAMRW